MQSSSRIWFDNSREKNIEGPNFTAPLPAGFRARQSGETSFDLIPPGAGEPPEPDCLISIRGLPGDEVRDLHGLFRAADSRPAIGRLADEMHLRDWRPGATPRERSDELREWIEYDFEGTCEGTGRPLRVWAGLTFDPEADSGVLTGIRCGLYRWMSLSPPCFDFMDGIELREFPPAAQPGATVIRVGSIINSPGVAIGTGASATVTQRLVEGE